jgi:hypothetical protein
MSCLNGDNGYKHEDSIHQDMVKYRIPEEQNPQLHLFKNVKTCGIFCVSLIVNDFGEKSL